MKVGDPTLRINSQLFSPFVTWYLMIKHKVWINTHLYCLIIYFLNPEFDWFKQMILITFNQFIWARSCISQSYSTRGPKDIFFNLMKGTNSFMNTHIPPHNLFHIQVQSYITRLKLKRTELKHRGCYAGIHGVIRSKDLNNTVMRDTHHIDPYITLIIGHSNTMCSYMYLCTEMISYIHDQ